MKEYGEPVYFFLEQGFHSLGRHIPAGKAGAAGGQDHIHIRTGNPALHTPANGGDIVFFNPVVEEFMPGLLQELCQKCARFVFLDRARVRNGQDGNANGNKGTRVIYFGHLSLFTILFTTMLFENVVLSISVSQR